MRPMGVNRLMRALVDVMEAHGIKPEQYGAAAMTLASLMGRFDGMSVGEFVRLARSAYRNCTSVDVPLPVEDVEGPTYLALRLHSDICDCSDPGCSLLLSAIDSIGEAWGLSWKKERAEAVRYLREQPGDDRDLYDYGGGCEEPSVYAAMLEAGVHRGPIETDGEET